MLQRPGALLLAAILAASCATSPIGSPSKMSSLSLSLSGLFPADRHVQALPAGSQAKVTVSGLGLAQPLSVTAAIDGSSAMAKLTGIPAGPNRVIEVEALDDAGSAIPGGRFRTAMSLQEGSNTAVISPFTTPRGDVFAKLLADGSDLARTLDASRVQALVEGIQRAQRVEHVALIDGTAIADALKANGGNLDALSTGEIAFVQASTRLTVTIKGLPSNLKADVWVDDPVSPVQTGLSNGNLSIAPIKPGSWRLHARAGTLRVGPVAVTPGPDATATLDFSRSVETLEAMPQARGAGASGVLKLGFGGPEEDALVVAGGLVKHATGSIMNQAKTSDRVVAFNGATWRTLDVIMPVPVSHAAAAVHDDALWVIGGLDSDGKATASVQVFDGETWSSRPDVPFPVVLGGAAAVGDQIVVVPGYQSLSFENGKDTFTLDGQVRVMNVTDPGNWTPLGTLATARMGAAVAVMGGKVYVISGLGSARPGTKPVYSVEVIDPQTGRISAIAPIPTARMSASAWVAGGKLYVAGGVDVLGKALDHLEAYDPLTDRWEILPPLRSSRAHAAAGLVNGKPVLAGGHDSFFYYGDLLPVAGAETLNP